MRFRKKPVEIEAIRFDDADETIGALVDFVAKRGGKFRVQTETDGVRRWRVVVIETLEGSMRTEPGDWIIRGVKGEFYPVKPHVFAATYEPVEEP